MKLLFLSPDHPLKNSFIETLAQVHREVVVEKQVSSLLDTLKKDLDVHIILLGAELNGFNEVVEQVRQLGRYLFILKVGDLSVKDEKEGQVISLDGQVSWEEHPKSLEQTLARIKSTVFYSKNLSEYSFEPKNFSLQQVYNIEKALDYVNSEKELLKELYEILNENIEKFRFSSSIEKNVLDLTEILQNAGPLGLERLSSWVTFFKDMAENAAFLYHAKRTFFQEKLNELRLEMVVALGCLKSSGFFKEDCENTDPLFQAKVLLVEDMPYNRILINKFLEKHESTIVEATNGQEAVDIWENDPSFDIIIMDMNMPVMDGFTATQNIRSLEEKNGISKTPIIALTALAMRGDREKCLSAGCDEYLSKPVDSMGLIKTCQSMLSLKGSSKKSQLDKGSKSSLNIEKVILKTPNQIYRVCLENIVEESGLQFEVVDTQSLMLKKVESMGAETLMILDGKEDFELAYFLKEKFPEKNIGLILDQEQKTNGLLGNSFFHFHYPFDRDQVHSVLTVFSEKVSQSQQQAEIIKDVASLKNLKSQVNIKEMVQKSDGQLAVWQKSFREIGGDLVLTQKFNYHGRFGFVLADVAGHDIKSGYTASWFSGLIEGVWAQHSIPVELLSYLNQLFEHESEEEDKRFVCALALLWDRVRCKLYYANAGIPGGILVKKDTGKDQTLDWRGVPIGMFPDVERFDNGVIDFCPGDRLYMATDGVLESIPNEVFLEINKSKSESPAEEALEAIVDFVSRSIQVTDDLTIAVLEATELPAPENGMRYSIPSTFESVDQVIQDIEAYAKSTIPYEFNWTMISVAIREALINAVEHGNKEVESAPIDIDVRLQGCNMVLIVSDLGSGFDLASVKKRLANEGTLRIHGRGIEMMENIAEKVAFQGGGIYLEFAPKKD